MEEDDILEKVRQVTETFKEKFRSDEIQNENEDYVDRLNQKLTRWQSKTTGYINEIIEEKSEELNQLHDRYWQEAHERYAKFREESEKCDSLEDLTVQIEKFNNYCQTNTIKSRLRSNIKDLKREELAEKLQLEYVPYDDSQRETKTAPSKSVNKSRTISSSSDSSSKTGPTIQISLGLGSVPGNPKGDTHKTASESTSSTHKSKREPIIAQEKPKTIPLKSAIQPRSRSSSGARSPIHTPVNPKRSQDSSKEGIHNTESVSTHVSTREPFTTPIKTTTIPSKSVSEPRSRSGSNTRSPLIDTPVNRNPAYSNGSELTSSNHPSKREQSIASNKSKTTTVDNSRKSPIRLYVGRGNILTPILVDKNSEVNKEDEKGITYSIDSIPIPKSKQQQSSNVNTDNDDFEKLVHAYRVLVEQENDNNQKHPPSPSDRNNDEEDNVFNLRKLNRTNYSTIMFREGETEINCISSSTKRNELIVYNSKLKVLIILQHENHKQCNNRLYLQWSDTISPQISDITYCQNNDKFLISTQDNRHLYFLNRDPSAIIELHVFREDLPLRRIHCYQQTVYCILGDNYLGEFQLDKEYSSLKFIRRITLFYPTDDPQDTTYHLLDITCDKNRLIVVYANDQDEIHLQSIDRKTRKLQGHLLLDESEHFNQINIRIESTIYDGNFIYLNGSRKHLKSIDFRNNDNGEITSKVARHKKPINLCFLEDGRLVILYKDPYFLSIHNSTNHQ